MEQSSNNAPEKPKRLGKGAVRQQAAALKKLMIENLQRYPIVEAACHKVGISRMTHYRWIKDDEEYAFATVGGLYVSSEVINDIAVSKVIEAMNRGERWAITFWLTHRHPQFNDDPIIRNMFKRIAKIEMREEELTIAAHEMQEMMRGLLMRTEQRNVEISQARLEAEAAEKVQHKKTMDLLNKSGLHKRTPFGGQTPT